MNQTQEQIKDKFRRLFEVGYNHRQITAYAAANYGLDEAETDQLLYEIDMEDGNDASEV